MANPTSEEIFSVPLADVNTALSALGLPVATDARAAVQSICELLNTNYNALVTATGKPLTTYTVLKEADNIDIDTQQQTFTITLNMSLTVNGVDLEPVV